jgi:hypothetical protein
MGPEPGAHQQHRQGTISGTLVGASATAPLGPVVAGRFLQHLPAPHGKGGGFLVHRLPAEPEDAGLIALDAVAAAAVGAAYPHGL